MPRTIERDHAKFKKIVRGKIRDDLKKYISSGELIGKKGKDFISIPVPNIQLPKFRFVRNRPGVGQGEGGIGTIISPGDPQEGNGEGGNQPGEHILEVDLTFEEFAQILSEALQLPRLQPKGSNRILTEKDRYNRISKVGPESLRHFRRTYKEALKRQISANLYNPNDPIIIPIKEDKRYLSWSVKQKPQSDALILYIMDVSGSMGDEQKEIVRIESFCIDTWISVNYRGVVTRYIIHDAVAQEVDKETFFHTRESGGTMISSAYELCQKIIEEEFPPELWNIYVFHFSDGDNDTGDNARAPRLLKELMPSLNLFGYGQVESTYGSGKFWDVLAEKLGEEENLRMSRISGKESILDSIKDFLGK